MNLIHRAVREGWGIDEDVRKDLPQLCIDTARDPTQDIRTRIKCIDIVRMMAKDNVDAAVALDKIERLENPELATERNELRVIVERLPAPSRDDL